jgi:predicted ArsR family transcriptional regulator
VRDQRDTGDQIRVADLDLSREPFFGAMIGALAGSLQDVIGLDGASGFISLVGQRVGATIDSGYRRALALERLNREQVAAVLVDLKRRIGGDFYVIEQDDDKIVLGNRACPFGDQVTGRPSLCMMTSNVFGRIAAENLGYGKVVLEETIAAGAAGCRVVVWLRPGVDRAGTDSAAANPQSRHEYFGAAATAERGWPMRTDDGK